MPLRFDWDDPVLGVPLRQEDPLWGRMGCADPGWVGPERVTVLASCSSALDVAWQLMRQGEFAPWDSVVCACQWAGRGQMRRSWVSPAGNLYASVRLPDLPSAWVPLVSLLVGSGVRQGLGVEALRLKWPNDLVLEGTKVGGILLEERDGVLVAGIGVNLVSAPNIEDLRSEAAVPAGVLPRSWPSVLALWRQLVHGLRLCYETIPASMSPAAWCSSLSSCLAWHGQWVQVGDHRSSICGVLHGVAEDGALCLMLPGGEEARVTSGSLRPMSPNS
jgi:BirA family biotin operon repressor/biotin-[acetyl-CoA-carboxylase] ligase